MYLREKERDQNKRACVRERDLVPMLLKDKVYLREKERDHMYMLLRLSECV